MKKFFYVWVLGLLTWSLGWAIYGLAWSLGKLAWVFWNWSYAMRGKVGMPKAIGVNPRPMDGGGTAGGGGGIQGNGTTYP